MPHATRAGDVLADRYRLVDLLSESGGGRFWRAHDRVLERHVALHVISAADPRAELLQEAARRSATVLDQRILRVLDVERRGDHCFVVNEWGSGTSLDIMLASNGPLSPRRGAWLVNEVADSIAAAHAHGVAHGLLSPENVLLDSAGSIKIIGFCVDAALHGLPPGDPQHDVLDLAGLLYATLTGRWAGASPSDVPRAPEAHGRVLRPRQVRAGVPRQLDDLCDELLNPRGQRIRDVRDHTSARGVHTVLAEFVGDANGLGAAIAAGNPDKNETVVLPAVPEILARPHPDDEPVDEPEPGPRRGPLDPEPEPGRRTRPDAVHELPTSAGLPIFDDENDEVSWLAREDPPPPPPPFEEPPERPLFAAEARKPRFALPDAGPVTARGDEYWPYDQTGSALERRAPGDGRRHPRAGARPQLDAARHARRGRAGPRWWRSRSRSTSSRGKTPLGAEPDDPAPTPTATPTPTASGTPQPITGLTAADYDPQGDGEENADQLAGAVDGNPDTAWTTLTYKQQLGPGGLKRGVGIVVDLGQARAVRTVELSLVGAPTALSVYVTDTVPTDVERLTAAGEVTADEATASLDLPAATSGRYLTVWLTSLPAVADGFKGGIVDLVVAG